MARCNCNVHRLTGLFWFYGGPGLERIEPMSYPRLPERQLTPQDRNEPDLAGALDCTCGYEPRLDDNGGDEENYECWLCCTCGARGPKSRWLRDAIEAWNDWIAMD